MKYLLLVLFFMINIFTQTINISVNQVGYLTDEMKYAVINGQVQKLFLYNENNEVVFEKDATLITNNDPATNYKTYLFDFSEFKQKGKYYIGDNAGLKSYLFEIGDNIFENLKYLSIKSYYFQRCGVPLLEQYIGNTHSRNACHTKDATYHPTAGSGAKDANGGWHDAGDYGKYTVPASAAVGQLLISYENFGSKFQSDDYNIPESGNNIPDILDEIRFELEWMLKMQRDTDGGVFWMVNTKNYFENMPDKSTATRYLYEVSTMATGDFAAVMAIANRIYKQYDPNFAQTCLDAAIKAWTYLEVNPNMVPIGGYNNPSDSQAGGYSMYQDKDKRLWAAAELFRTTEIDKYNNYFVSKYSKQSGAAFSSVFGWYSVNSLAHLAYLLTSNSKVDATVKNNLRNQLVQYSNSVINTTNKDGYQVGMGTGDYYWGSNGVVLNKAFMLVFAHILTNDKKYYDSALKQLNYILGVNAHNITFVSGVGTKSPLKIHHAPSFNKTAVPGFVVGGPESELSDPELEKKFTSSTPPALCYVDHVGSYASNEITIYWNSGLVALAGYFTNNLTSIKEEPKLNTKKDIELNNYPNPFNSTTKINFKIHVEDNIKLVIFDSIGRKVLEKDYGIINPGIYNFDWNGKNYLNQDVASGVYIYQIIGKKEKYYTNKMVLLK